MNLRTAKKLERLVSAFAIGLMVVTPMSLNAQEDGATRSNLDWPLAENQCSEYLYEVYSKSPELSGPTPKNQNDFPEARISPAIPAICDDLVGHDWPSFGGHHTERVRLSRRFSNVPPPQDRKTSCETLKRLAALDWTSVEDEPEFAGHLDFQGTCYEQSLNLRTLPEHHPFTDSSSLTDLLERAVSSAISKVRTLNEEYRPYDLVIADPLPVCPAVDYWQAHENLNIEAYRASELSYWDAHRHLDITPRREIRLIDMELWAAAPSLLSTYQSWIVTHPYVQSPARAQRDFWQYVELKLHGTEALERWHQLMHLKPSVSPQSPIEPTTPVHAETVLWFADLLDQTGRQFQRASSHLTQIVERSARHSRLRCPPVPDNHRAHRRPLSPMSGLFLYRKLWRNYRERDSRLPVFLL